MSIPPPPPGGRPPTLTGRALRQRVRRITAAVVGTATLAAGLLTANLAWAASDEQSATPTTTDGTTGSVRSDGDDDGDGDDAGPATSSAPRSTTALTAPQQLPNASGGRGQARSGGS